MSTVYLFALAGVAIAIVATLAATVLSLAAKPDWRAPHFRFGKRPLPVAPVATNERRHEQLPFVGTDRRQTAEEAAEALRRAA